LVIAEHSKVSISPPEGNHYKKSPMALEQEKWSHFQNREFYLIPIVVITQPGI